SRDRQGLVIGEGAGMVVLFPPSISLGAARNALQKEDVAIRLGVQNIHWEPSGAFTGEIAAEMAAELGADYALVGHSERRHLFGETDEDTARKSGAVRRAGLTPVLCVGETLDEREAGRLEEVVLRQLDAVVAETARETAGTGELLLAYEPVWAIGTGRTATPDDASQAHGILRDRLARHLGEDRARNTPILYGGSVNPGNAEDLLAAPDVDGVLVGGASLDPDSFRRIAACAG
ncbi:MAG: triose-phosphate isomerase, partial [Gemmatimonadota bacterium]